MKKQDAHPNDQKLFALSIRSRSFFIFYVRIKQINKQKHCEISIVDDHHVSHSTKFWENLKIKYK